METLTSGIRRTAGARARLPFMLSSLSGRSLNCADVGRLIGVARPTALAYLRTLEDIGLTTRIPFLGGGKRPLLVAWEDVSPRAELVRALQALCPRCRLYWWSRTRKRVVDLVVDLGNECLGFCFSSSVRPQHRDWEPLRLAIGRNLITRGFVVHNGDQVRKRLDLPVFCMPSSLLLGHLEDWLFTWRAPRESWQAMYRINRARRPSKALQACAGFP